MYSADIVRGSTYLPFEPLIVASLIYFVLTFSLSKVVALIEKNLGCKTDKSFVLFDSKVSVREPKGEMNI
jgi:polar amino acid transport system permease protein